MRTWIPALAALAPLSLHFLNHTLRTHAWWIAPDRPLRPHRRAIHRLWTNHGIVADELELAMVRKQIIQYRQDLF